MIQLLRKLWNNPMTDVVIATVSIASGLGLLHKVTQAAQDRLSELQAEIRTHEAKLAVHRALAVDEPVDDPWRRPVDEPVDEPVDDSVPA